MKPDTAFSQKTRVLIINNFQHRQSQKMPPAFFSERRKYVFINKAMFKCIKNDNSSFSEPFS